MPIIAKMKTRTVPDFHQVNYVKIVLKCKRRCGITVLLVADKICKR